MRQKCEGPTGWNRSTLLDEPSGIGCPPRYFILSRPATGRQTFLAALSNMRGDTMSIVENSDETSDIVWSATAIAAVIRRSERQTFYLLENGALPAKRVGGRWVASRKKLLAAVIGD